MTRYVINGRFLAERMTGIQRYAYEITRELDKLVGGMGLEILVPADAFMDLSGYNNIRVVRSQRKASQLWEQVTYPYYLRKHRALGVNLCNIVPILRPNGIACIHDISYKVNPDFFKGSVHSRVSKLWHCINYSVITKHCEHVLTVSEFSKNEIIANYRICPKRITVIQNSWEHFTKEMPDNCSFEENYPFLQSGSYYYSMCSAGKNKNLKWVIEIARSLPNEVFAISGMYDPARFGEELDFGNLPNVHHLGYVSDEAAKLLLQNCKAFLFPTLYEGFGLPPMEALALGADCVVSDIPVMHEVYGDAVSYIDPEIYTLNWRPVGVEKKQELLKRFSWQGSAEKLLRVVKDG